MRPLSVAKSLTRQIPLLKNIGLRILIDSLALQTHRTQLNSVDAINTVSPKSMQFPLTLTAAFLRRSHFRELFRGWWKILASVSVIILMWIADETGTHTGPLMIFAISALGLYVALCVFVWFRQARAIEDWLKKQGAAPVIYSLSEEAVEASSEIGSTKLKWDAFKKITLSDFDTLLVFPFQGTLRLPTAQIPKEALEFLKSRFAAHGKKIEDKRKPG